jgi:hypothetical protein
MPRRHAVFQEVAFMPGKASYKVLTNRVVSTLRGDTGWDGREYFSWLIFNRAKGECLEQGGGESMNNPAIFYNVGFQRSDLRRLPVNDWNWRMDEAPIPVNWANDAQISFFSSETCGRIDLPYEVKSVDLPH